jgi:hypothetical protein
MRKLSPTGSKGGKDVEVGSIIVAAMALATTAAQPAHAQYFTRYEWIPSGSFTQSGSGVYVGDLWTFVCPRGGTVLVVLHNQDDNGGTSNLDPAFKIFDGDGNLVTTQDDGAGCPAPPECGFSCPLQVETPCGAKNPHSIAIYSSSTACAGGGAYHLGFRVRDANGNSVSPAKVKLGGGPKAKVPSWVDPIKARQTGPALDDERLIFP